MSEEVTKQRTSDTHASKLTPEEAVKAYQTQQVKMFEAIRKMVIKDATGRGSSSLLSGFTIEQISTYLKDPDKYQKQLRKLSNYLYSVNGYYKNIIHFFALMPTYAYTVEPYSIPENYDKEKYKKAYFKTLKDIEKMSLRHELTKVMKTAFKNDLFYGYVLEAKDSFFIMHLDADYCKISSYEDGVFNFAFDFSFFDRNQDLLQHYPDEFKLKYQYYTTDKQNNFIELDPKYAICVKVNEEVLYPIIPFVSIIEAIFDYDDYKKIKKQKTKMDNFLLLTQQIPQGDKNEVDFFTINLDLASQFHDMLSQSVPDGVAVALSPMKIEPIKMEKSKNDSDIIAQAQREIFSDAGVPQQLFNSDKNSAAGINKSLLVSQQIVFAVLRQFERWINRRLTKNSGQYKFHIKFLDITTFNEKEVQDQLHKAATASLPMVSEYAASLGMTPLDLYHKAILENEVLGLHDILKPLASSYTQSKNSEKDAGREELDDSDITDSTEAWRETDDAQGE